MIQIKERIYVKQDEKWGSINIYHYDDGYNYDIMKDGNVILIAAIMVL